MIRWKFQLDGSTVLDTLAPKVPPRSYRYHSPSNEDRGDAKKKQHPQMEPKCTKTTTKKREKDSMLSWNPKKTICCSPWKNFQIQVQLAPNLPL